MSTNQTTILVVDDEVSICTVVQAYLSSLGYRVLVAYQGEEALAVIDKERVDLVLSDIKMPGMSGVELLRSIKEVESSIPVILSTGYPTLDTAVEALKLGAYDYITKPFHIAEVGKKVERALERKRLVEENLVFSRLVSLHEVTRQLSTVMDPSDFNQTFAFFCRDLTSSDAVLIASVEDNVVSVLASIAPDGVPLAVVGGLDDLLRDVNSEDPLIVAETQSDMRCVSIADAYQTVVAYPLSRSRTKARDMAIVARRRPGIAYSNVDLEILHVLTAQAGVAMDNARLYIDIRENFIKTVSSFARAVEAKDTYTHGHSENVMRYAGVLAESIALPSAEVEIIRFAGLLHDIGKIGIDEAVLNKPGRLTDEEFEHIKQHPVIGTEILVDLPFPRKLIDYVRHHHEMFGGSGYPDALSGEEIPLGARILTVADAYEAMTSNRPYRKAMEAEAALAILTKEKVRQFDPALVDAFVELVRGGRI